MKKLPLSLLTLTLIAVFFVSTRQISESAPNDNETAAPFQVRTLTAKLSEGFESSRTYLGEVVPGRQTELSFVRSGELVSLNVDEGQTVSKGQALATLDRRALRARGLALQAELSGAQARLRELQAGPRQETIASAQARVERLRRQLALSESKLQRRSQLYQEGAVARELLDEFETERDAAQDLLLESEHQLRQLQNGTRTEEVEQQRARVHDVQARLIALDVEVEDTVLRAPFSGRISKRHLDEGSVVSPGRSILTLFETRGLEARIALPVGLEAEEAKLMVHGESVNAKFLGHVPEVDSRSETSVARFQLPREFVPGTSVSARVERWVAQEGIWLPTDALLARGRGLFTCYVLRDGEVTSHQVEVLHSESDRVLVRGTLSPGDQVITQGADQVTVGQRAIAVQDTAKS